MLDNSQKYDLLKTMYLENNKELVFWRERNWSALKLVIGAYIAIAGVTTFRDAPRSLSFLVLALAVVASVYLHKNFTRYQEKRTLGSRLEQALSVYEKSAFIPNDTLLPAHFQDAKAAKSGSYSFIAAIWIVALAVIAALMLA
jgi:hypothetical protein